MVGFCFLSVEHLIVRSIRHQACSSLSQKGLGHNTGVVMRNLPFAVFIGVDVGITGLDLVTSGSHGDYLEFKHVSKTQKLERHYYNNTLAMRYRARLTLVDTGIHAPVVTLDDVGFQNDSLWLLLEEVNKVGLDRIIVRTGNIRDGGEEDRRAGITLGNRVGIQGREGVVPEREERLDFSFRDGRSACLGRGEERAASRQIQSSVDGPRRGSIGNLGRKSSDGVGEDRC